VTNNKRTLSLTFICIFLFGCSIFSPKQNEKASYSVDGIWSGYSDQQELVMFLIKDNSLSKFYFGTSRDCKSGKKDYYLFNMTRDIFMVRVPVQDNKLSLTVRETYETAPNKFRADFQSEFIASGTFDISWDIDSSCKGQKTITWQAIRNILPKTNQCTKVLDGNEDELAKVTNGSCVEKMVTLNGKTESRLFAKREKGTTIAPYSGGSIFLIFSSNDRVIRYMPRSNMYNYEIFGENWEPWFQVSPDDLITGTGLTQKGVLLFLPNSELPILEWNGSFYVTLVDFYEPIERYDFSKEQ
jgi:hypothetical protein